MKKQFKLRYTLLLALYLLTAACKKTDDGTTPGQTNEPRVLQTNSWRVVAKDSFSAGGASGGGVGSFALDLQNENELRFYYEWATQNYSKNTTELVLNQAGQATKDRSLTYNQFSPSYLKTVRNNQVWRLVPGYTSSYTYYTVHLNNKAHKPLSTLHNTNLRVTNAADGFFVYGTNYSHTESAFFNILTDEIRTYNVSGNNFIPVRYNGATYGIDFGSSLYATDSVITFYKENASGLQPVHQITHGPLTNQILYFNTMGNSVYVLVEFRDYKTNGTVEAHYGVYKANLYTYTCTVLQSPLQEHPYYNTAYPAKNALAQAAIDADGNLYMIEDHLNSPEGRYSIRKYRVTGGSELVLKQQDLLKGTLVHGIVLFHGSLYAGISYAEQSQAGSLFNNYYLSVIKMN